MIGCLRTRVRKQPIIALYFEFETEYLCLFVGATGGDPYDTSRPDSSSQKCKYICEDKVKR